MADSISGHALRAHGWTQGTLLGLAKKTGARLLARGWDHEAVLDTLDAVRMQPLSHEADPDLGALAAAVLAEMERDKRAAARSSFALRATPIAYRSGGVRASTMGPWRRWIWRCACRRRSPAL